jgi:phosphoserine phosphatase RsbU/P
VEQRTLYRTINNILKEAPKFSTTEEMLSYVLGQTIKNEDINILGGRIWKLNEKKTAYYLIEQIGEVAPIEKNYEMKVNKFPSFLEIGKNRTIMSTETDNYLISKGIFHYSATGIGERFKIKKDDNVYYLYKYLIAVNSKRVDNEFIYTLNIISTTLSSVLRTKRIEKKAKQNIADLEKASEIQKSILPDHYFNFGNYEIFGISIPDRIVGGDFFDYIETGENYKLCIAIGDAASKGISAAAQALYVSGALKMGVEYDINMTSLIKKINNLVNETFPNERFVTLFYCEIYKDQKGLCVFVNAGHNSPYYYNSSSNKIEELRATGPVLGPSPDQKYYTDSIYLGLNDVVVLYTDGIVEATNSKFEFYGDERLKSFILKNVKKNVKELCELLIQDVQTFSANGKYSDDKTLVVVKRVR